MITEEQWEALHALPVDPCLTDPAVKPVCEIYVVKKIVRTDEQGYFQMSFRPGEIYGFIAFEENYLGLMHRRHALIPDENGMVKIPAMTLYPAATVFVVVVQSGFVLTFRIVEFPTEAFAAGYSFGDVPIWLAWLFIVMASLVAGICEEIGFRGYMQVPLERRYGPVPSLVIVSIVFVVLHLNQAWAPPILFHLFAISLMLGILAYTSGSLIPGIIGHTVMDIPNFAYWWTDVAGTFDKQPIADTGVDSHFVVWVLIFVASVVLFCWATRQTAAARR